jgi:hypothetical protein
MPRFEIEFKGGRYEVEAPDEQSALGAFDQSMNGPPQVQQMPQHTGTLPALARGAADTLTFGTSDEIAAGLNTAWDAGKAALGLGQASTFDENVARSRAAHAYDEQNNPYARLGGQVAGGVGSGLGMARAGLLATPRLAATASRPVRYGVAAGEGAALSGAYGLGSGEGAVGRLEEGAKALGPGAIFGAAGETVAPAISTGARWAANAVRGAVQPNLNAARSQIAQVLGISPADIPDTVAAEFARQADRVADPAAAARVAAGSEFGIPMTRGQATRDPTDLAFEEAARHEARGVTAGKMVRDVDDEARAAIERNKTALAEEFNAGRPVTTTSQNELSQEVLEGVRDASQRAKQGVDEAYDAARGAGVQVKSGAVLDARARVREGLEEQGFIINPTTTPYATRALQEFDELYNLRIALRDDVTGQPGATDDKIAGVALEGIEKVRSRLIQYAKNATPEDARAVQAVRRQFDSWLDDVGDDQLLAGTPEGLGMFKAARKARREYGEAFEANKRQSDDDAGRLMQKLLNKDVTESEVANALMGSAKAGERGVSARLAARLKNILGQESPEFGTIKQAVWFRIVNGDKGEAGKLGPQALSQRILNFTTGKAEPYAKILYTPAEMAKMRRFAKSVEQLVTPPHLTNPSKTSYGVARSVQAAAQAVLPAMVGGATGSIGAGLFARVLAGLGTEAKNFGKARRAVGGPPRARYRPQDRGGVAGAAAGYTASGDDPTASLPLRIDVFK